MKIQKPPTKEILVICCAIEDLITRYLAAIPKCKIKLGRFEGEFEAYTLNKLILRHAESVVLMARHDLVLLPSAQVVARAAFEAHLKALWLIKPVDPFEQEARWVAHLRSAAEHWTNLAKSAHLTQKDRDTYAGQAKIYSDFADTIIESLSTQGDYPVPSKMPTLWDILKDIDEKFLYPTYTHLSAFAHSNFEAGNLYRKNLGTGTELGEFIEAKDWGFPLEVVFMSFGRVSKRVLELMEVPPSEFPWSLLSDLFYRLKGLLRENS